MTLSWRGRVARALLSAASWIRTLLAFLAMSWQLRRCPACAGEGFIVERGEDVGIMDICQLCGQSGLIPRKWTVADRRAYKERMMFVVTGLVEAEIMNTMIKGALTFPVREVKEDEWN